MSDLIILFAAVIFSGVTVGLFYIFTHFVHQSKEIK